MTEHEVLCRAKAYLLTHGWARGFGGHGGPRCVLGALVSATDDREGLAMAGGRLLSALPARGADSLILWNDAPERTLADVIDAFDEAILAAAPAEAREVVSA